MFYVQRIHNLLSIKYKEGERKFLTTRSRYSWYGLSCNCQKGKQNKWNIKIPKPSLAIYLTPSNPFSLSLHLFLFPP